MLGVPVLEEVETREWLDEKLDHWRERGFGVWMFRDLDGALVGRCGIHHWLLDGRAEVEIGYVVHSALWTQGYATEMAEAVVERSASSPSRTWLGSLRRTTSRPRRVLEKLGFAFERTFVSGGKSSVLYRRRARASTTGV